MAEKPIPVTGWKGVDTTTDEFLLGQQDPQKSSLAYNYRVKNGVRVGRKGYTPVIDFASSVYPKKSGVYFPPGSKAILPHRSTGFTDSFYMAGTEELPQTEFTVEFWYRGDFTDADREFCRIPVDFGTDDNGETVDSHMYFYLKPSIVTPNTARLYGYIVLGDNTSGSENVRVQEYYKTSDEVLLDGEWHHIAIYSKPSTKDDLFYILDGGTEQEMDGQNALSNHDQLIRSETYQDDHASPHYYNHMEIGGSGLSIAEFRMWNVRRSATEIANFKDVELEGDEDNLVIYVPFNEGEGKVFTEVVNNVTGHFSPQSPYVNDDNELVFTGYNCMAYPSLRPKWVPPEDGLEPTHDLDNQDAAYDGGIAWDTVIGMGDSVPGNAFNFDDEGTDFGVLQLRIRLQQLKEGVICGRLGMLYDNSSEALQRRLCGNLPVLRGY
jgi:hypothetical protein